MSGGVWGMVGQIAGELAGLAMTAHAQHKANRTNIQLMRENQAWSERMSNSAYQRSVADIRAAGGNPALAFTGGQTASTPSVATAEVRPANYAGVGRAIMTALSAKQLQAETKKTDAEARITNVEADIRESIRDKELEQRANRFIESREWDDIKTKILRENVKSSAAEARRLEGSVDSIITQLQQQVEHEDLTIKQLRNIVNVGGLAPEDRDSILRYLIDVLFRNK